jgi:Phosphotransferase enzyme family
MTNQFRTEKERKVTLSRREQEKILDIDPSFISISQSIYFDNYDLPCPVRVEVKTADDNFRKVVLRKTRHGDIRLEVKMLQSLHKFGLPVPQVLSKPFKNEYGEWCAIYSFLPGENLQKLSSRSEEGLQQAKELLIQAVQKLISASEFIATQKELKDLPRITLTQELEKITQKKDAWLADPLFQSAVTYLGNKLPAINTPLVLTNGDYQPGNFLAQGNRLTGFLDFESPSFQDPMMGFVKYPIYDLKPLSRTDIIDRFLDAMGFSRKDYSIRLILGCLKILQKEIPLKNGDEEMSSYGVRVYSILKKELDKSQKHFY